MIVFEMILGVIFLLFIFSLYFMPTLVAVQKKKINVPAIFILNLFFGWTMIGWVGALIWAYCK